MEPTQKLSSASPDETGLLGVDPDDISTVKYGPAEFDLGVAPAGVWVRVSSKMMLQHQHSKREGIARLHARGEDPETVMEKIGELSITKLDEEYVASPAHREAMQPIYLEAVKYSLRDLRGFKIGKAGREFKLEFVDEEINGITVKVLSPKMLKVFGANGQLIEFLYLKIRTLNELDVIGKKS